MENTEADGTNGILRNTAIAVPLKYLSNFWRTLEMPLINYKVKFKLNWTNHCILSALGADNADAYSNNIIFNIFNIIFNFNVPVVTFSAKDNKKISKLLSKGFEGSVYERTNEWVNEYKTKIENKNKDMINEYRYFLDSNYVRFNRLFTLIYSSQDDNAKRYNVRSLLTKRCY